ncbi:MAG: patatin-like phospholipase family protein [Holosporales bacterium]|jgi:NTE family protein|nr:patatin-like phospholipase family protein [Holosporales bacterium]
MSQKKLTPSKPPLQGQKSFVAPKKIAIALQGGGAHGAFTWGVLDKFLEDGRFEIEGLSGTSAGGLNAVALAQGLMNGGLKGAREELYRLWRSIADLSIFSPLKPLPYEMMTGYYNLDNSPGYLALNFLMGLFSPYEINPMGFNYFRDFIGDFFDFDLLSQCPTKLFLCATQVSSGKLKIFSTHEMSLDALMASACLPNMFHSVKIGDEHYWDGGFVGNPPIYPLIDSCETSDIVVIQLSVMSRKLLPRSASEIIERHKEITYNSCLMREMRSIDFVTDLIDKGLIPKDKIKRLFMHLIRDEALFCSLELSSALNSSWDFLEFLYTHGRQVATSWIKEHYDGVGVRTTTNIHKEFVAN